MGTFLSQLAKKRFDNPSSKQANMSRLTRNRTPSLPDDDGPDLGEFTTALVCFNFCWDSISKHSLVLVMLWYVKNSITACLIFMSSDCVRCVAEGAEGLFIGGVLAEELDPVLEGWENSVG